MERCSTQICCKYCTSVLIYVHGYILARVIVKSLSVPLYRSYSVLFIGAHYLNQPALQK